MKNKRIEMFDKYMEFESISLRYDLTEAKKIYGIRINFFTI